MEQQVPVNVRRLDVTSGPSVSKDCVIGVRVDARTTAGTLSHALRKHEGWPKGLHEDEINGALMRLIGLGDVVDSTRPFPDVYPEELPPYKQGFVDIFVSEIVQEGRWVVIDGLNHEVTHIVDDYPEAVCAAWEYYVEKCNGDRYEPAIYAYFGIEVPAPKGYEIEYNPGLGSWVWYQPTSYGRYQLDGFKTEIDARVGAWRHKLGQDAVHSSSTHSYQALHDGLSDMIEGGRLTRADIPDDYDWLVESLAGLGNEPDHKAALDEIHALVDGREWDGETTCMLINTLVSAGYTVREPDEESV